MVTVHQLLHFYSRGRVIACNRFVNAMLAKRLEMFFRALLLGVLWFSFCCASIPGEKRNPGLVIRLTPSALTFASDVWVKRTLADYIRDSMRGTNQTKNCFADSCSLQNFTVSSSILPVSNVTVRRGLGVLWKLEKAEFNIDLNFELTKTDYNGTARVKGIARVYVGLASLVAELDLYRLREGGGLHVALANCSTGVLVLGSDAFSEWELDNSPTFKNSFNANIRNYLEDRVNESLSAAMRDLAVLATRVIPNGVDWLNTQLRSTFGIFLEDTLANDLIFENNYIEAAYNGEFKMVGDKVGSSFSPPNLNLPPPDNSMTSVYMSEYFTNTFLDVLFKTGRISVNITKDLLPRSYIKAFDTTCEETVCFGTIFPTISEMYPNDSVKLVIGAAKGPSVTYYQDSQRAQGEFDLSIVLPRVDGSVVVAKLSVFVSIAKSLYPPRDRAAAEYFTPKITIKDNGSLNEFTSYLPRINFVMQSIADFFFFPRAYNLGAMDLPLYLPFGIRLVNTDFGPITNAFHFSTDIIYNPKGPLVYDYDLYSLCLPILRRMVV